MWPDCASTTSWPELGASAHQERTHRCFADRAVRPSILELQMLNGMPRPRDERGSRRCTRTCIRFRVVVMLWFVAAVAIASCGMFAAAWLKQPLLPPQFEDVSWNQTWLVVALSYHLGSCICFCTIICTSESGWRAALWVSCCFTLGTPAIAVYVLLRLLSHGSVHLASSSNL